MYFLSTRNKNFKVKAPVALIEGISPDGGLFVPEDFSRLNFPMERLAEMTPAEISATVLDLYFGEDLFGKENAYSSCLELVGEAYAGFPRGDYAPVKSIDGAFVAELWHGPTCAFKDVALQILPRLAVAAKRVEKSEDELVFLTATSGDTGGAALEGFSDVEGTRVIVFYPKSGTSKIQERQMVSCKGKNAFVAAVEGNFDDAQNGVKEAMKKMSLPKGYRLSSANSINIGRLVPQTAYYFKAYRDLLRDGAIKCGEKVNFVVPTGNFGDILAGLFAEKTGLPIGRLVCASNKNKVLTDFLETGVYDAKREFFVTNAPSMDILVSSNLERLLYLVCGDEKCSQYMAELKNTGKYAVTSEELSEIRKYFDAGYADENEVLTTINRVFNESGYLMDTHTAVAECVRKNLTDEGKLEGVTVVLSTASAYKFPTSVLKAFGKEGNDEFSDFYTLADFTGAPIPDGLRDIGSKKVVHKSVIAKNEIADYIKKRIL